MGPTFKHCATVSILPNVIMEAIQEASLSVMGAATRLAPTTLFCRYGMAGDDQPATHPVAIDRRQAGEENYQYNNFN